MNPHHTVGRLALGLGTVGRGFLRCAAVHCTAVQRPARYSTGLCASPYRPRATSLFHRSSPLAYAVACTPMITCPGRGCATCEAWRPRERAFSSWSPCTWRDHAQRGGGCPGPHGPGTGEGHPTSRSPCWWCRPSHPPPCSGPGILGGTPPGPGRTVAGLLATRHRGAPADGGWRCRRGNCPGAPVRHSRRVHDQAVVHRAVPRPQVVAVGRRPWLFPP